ncbi:autotransporter-associated beta strand repeat protein [Cladochytrium replicatum]|nr:autotransporter-associated beta strand repeat protein [Cladochytrium replicatum]
MGMSKLVVFAILGALASTSDASPVKCIPRPSPTTTTTICTTTAAGATGTASPSPYTPSPVGSLPEIPAGSGIVDSAPVQDEKTVKPFVDYAYTNVRDNPCNANLTTNAGARLLEDFLNYWKPSTLLVDAGLNLAGTPGCPAVVSTWSGIPGDKTDGTVLDQNNHRKNLDICIDLSNNRTDTILTAAYLEDRRSKGFNLVDGLGALKTAWFGFSKSNTTITLPIPADAANVSYSDGGNDIGDCTSNNPTFVDVCTFIGHIGDNASTEPSKRFWKYARPFRWDTRVSIPSILKPRISTTPITDGGTPSGHTAEAYRRSVVLGYLIPERLSQTFYRASESGNLRIVAGFHSPYDVIGGRILGTASVAANVYAAANAATKVATVAKVHSVLMAATNTTTLDAFRAFANSLESDPFSFNSQSSYKARKSTFEYRMTYGFTPKPGQSGKTANVPKAAEILLETRFPYLTAAQRRVVLKSTAIDSGYPITDDAEGWGRLNYFAAGQGYGRFDGDVDVTYDLSSSTWTTDAWRNDIAGAGKLTKRGTATLQLTGDNSYTGGTVVLGGALVASSRTAFGTGSVYNGAAVWIGTAGLTVKGYYAQTKDSTLAFVVDGKATTPLLSVAGDVSIAGGQLLVELSGSVAKGTRIQLIGGASAKGVFDKATLPAGASIEYIPGGVVLAI